MNMSFRNIFKKDKLVDQMNGTSTEGTTGKVNINDLINRNKKEQTKKKTETVFIFCLALTLMLVVGFLVSL